MNKPLEEYTKEELIDYIGSLKKQKKYGLVWEEKPEMVAEECQEKLPIVKEDASRAILSAPGEKTNLIIEGDNYHALSVLNYTHAGKIDVIYIDPPYNTGNADFVYNDNYVDKEDSYRHSKWLSFMEKRLTLAKNLLSDEGVIFISIDDNEQADLKLLCDEVFGVDNFVSNMVWAGNRTGKNDSKNIRNVHEYILVYFKNSQSGKLLGVVDKDEKKYKHSDERGPYYLITLDQSSLSYSSSMDYIIEHDGKRYYPGASEELWKKRASGDHGKKDYIWRWNKEKVKKAISDGFIVFKNNRVYTKQYRDFDSDGNKVERTILKESIINQYSTRGGKDLLKIILNNDLFNYAKPMDLIKDLVELYPDKNAIVLDFFAGSGTTGHAVIALNREDGGNRQFILCTSNENNIANNVTYPRIKTIIDGIRPDGTKYSDGMLENLRYFKTKFIDKGATTDDTREALVTECADMIRIKEGTFEFVASSSKYQFYKNNNVFVSIIFDQFTIEETWEKVEELNADRLPVHVYNFSYNRHANEEEIPETDLEWTACSIPESVLEVYRKIFRRKGGKAVN